MRRSAGSLFLIFLITLTSGYVKGQGQCDIFTEYKDDIKKWATATIDSLKALGNDSIIYYGIGSPETGWTKYGKILWAHNGKINKLEIRVFYKDDVYHISSPQYAVSGNYAAFQFYAVNRLDTVKTNPKELHWMSHDFLHYVFATVSGMETCFTAPDYLLYDAEHLRAKWIYLLNKRVPPHILIKQDIDPEVK